MQMKTIRSILKNAGSRGWVPEPDAKKLLAAARIPVPRFGVFQDKDDALDFAGKLGFPVVAKIVSPAVIHKSDVGGVRPGIRDRAELSVAFDQLGRHEPLDGILVEEMIEGVELIVGGQIDLQFGPVVLLGMGGVAVEIYKDTAIMMAPLRRQDVYTMLGDIKGASLLTGFRGRAGVDVEALVDLVFAFSGLLSKISGDVSSVDLNPVICSPRGCVVADARLILSS
ncbi:MAG: acetate--CoA ligase family protein [Desulfosarcinaceae bacterium]